MPFGIGIWEILILLLVVLLVFGPKRLPEMGRSLGKGLREFKEGVTSPFSDDEEDREEPALEAGKAPGAVAAAAERKRQRAR